VPSHQTSPSAGQRATLVKIVLLAGMATALRSMSASGRVVRRRSLASEGRSKGDSLELRWYAGLKANEPDNTTVWNCFMLNPVVQGLSLTLPDSMFHARLKETPATREKQIVIPL